jgi:glycosyltransferase involved in cell wall biosynthesis
MKILYLSLHPNIGYDDISGPGMHIREVIRGLEECGNEVIWVSTNSKSEQSQNGEIRIQKAGVKGMLKKLIPPVIWETLVDIQLIRTDRRFDRKLQLKIEAYQPDMIYERAYYMMGSGHRMARRNKIPYLVEMNSPYTLEKPQMSHKSWLARLAERNERQQFAAMNFALVVTSSLKEYFADKYPDYKDKLIVTPNAVREEYILRENDITDTSLRQELGLLDTDLLITFIGSIFPYHGVDLLIEAFGQALKMTNKRMKLLIIGDGEILPDLKKLTDSLGLKGSICFAGKVPNEMARRYLAASQIAVQANCTWYNSPIKLFEYGSQRVAIIAPKCPGVEDVMTDGEDGVLISPDKESLLKALMLLVDNPEIRERHATRFHEKVSTLHTWRETAKKIVALVR